MRNEELEAQRMQSRQLEALRGQVALQIKTNRLEKVENPYVLVERRSATTAGRRRQPRGSEGTVAATSFQTFSGKP